MAKAKTPVKKTTAAAAKPSAKVVDRAPAKKAMPAKKVDVVDEVKRELKKEVVAVETTPKKGKRGMGLTWLAVIIVVGLVFGIQWLVRTIKVEQIKRDLPATIEQLGGGMALKDINGWAYEGGVWKFNIVFDYDGQDTEFPSWITQDGKTLFTSGINIEEFNQQATEGATGAEATVDAATCESVNKADTGHLDAYVVSQCPYGLQMQRAIATAIEEAPELASQVTVRYIGEIVDGKITAMHGEAEAAENANQICIREEQSDKYWPYIGCYMKAGDSASCFTEAGIDTAALTACTTGEKVLEYAQADFDLANQHQVSGSPSLVVNNTESVSENNFGGRSAEGVKQMICCSSTNQPAFCSQTLTTEQAAVSYSEEVTSASGATAAGSC